jgi:hypothetical protein
MIEVDSKLCVTGALIHILLVVALSGDVIGARMGAGSSSDTAFPSTPTENPR